MNSLQSWEQAMRIELVAGMSNVVRFPIERRARPTLDLLRFIAPDVREVLQAVESFELDMPEPELRHTVDEEVASYIADHVRPEPGAARQAQLEAILTPVVRRGVEACRVAHDAALIATHAQQRVVDAQSAGSFWLEPLEERANTLSLEAAQLLVDAHISGQEAEGASRAVGIALRGETWAPFDPEAEVVALFSDDQRVS